MILNVWVAWLAILAGVVTGAVQGLFFKSDTWLGGYASWPRRMMRLGHISFFGIAFINLAFACTAQVFIGGALEEAAYKLQAPMYAFAAANVLMPAVCFASAWKKQASALFFVPVGCVIFGVVTLLVKAVTLGALS